MKLSRTCLMVISHDFSINDAYKEKFLGIARALCNEGYTLKIIGFWGSSVVSGNLDSFEKSDFKTINKRGIFKKVLMRISFAFKVTSFLKKNPVDVVFIRYPVLDPLGMNMIYQSKKIVSNAHFIFEVPTVVGGNVEVSENTPLARRILFRISDRLKIIALKYIDTIAGVSFKGKYFGYEVTPVENAVTPKLSLFKSRCPMDNVMKMIFVLRPDAENIRHGLDRILYGISDYIQHNMETSVELHVIGMTPEQVPINLVNLARLKQVKFYGERSRGFIENLSKEMHLGIGQLGFHRIGLTHGSALKEREYLANALPIVTSCSDNLFLNDVPFRLNFPQSDEPIDLSRVVIWARNFHSSDNYRREMLTYLNNNARWNHAYKNVFKRLREKSER